MSPPDRHKSHRRGRRPGRPGEGRAEGVLDDEGLALVLVIGILAVVLAKRAGLSRSVGRPSFGALVVLGLATAGGVVVVGVLVVRRRFGNGHRRTLAARHRGGAREGEGARWAEWRELSRLAVADGEPGRLVLGTLKGRPLALEPRQSLLVVGPTQSGKTSGLAIPAILEWRGPVVSTSVKTDLVRATFAWRSGLGRALVYDPTAVSGCPRSSWSPLASATTWAGARRVASFLCSVARAGSGSGLEDGGFWYATAEKLLAPLLLAASTSGGSISDVVRWMDTEEVNEVVIALELVGAGEALQAAEASFGREERQRSSVYATAETVLAAFADPLVAACSGRDDIDVARLVGGSSDTVYLVAPAHEQERLQAPFVAILRSILDAAFTASTAAGSPLDPPLLLVLDEAANVAPLAGLDTLVATAASHGIQVVTLWQDLAQIEARYAGRAATVVNNHRAKLVCSGVADPSTLGQISRLIGDEVYESESRTRDATGHWSSTTSDQARPLAPTDLLRRLSPREAVLLYANLPPARVDLRPYFEDRRLSERAGLELSAPDRRRAGPRARLRRRLRG